MIPKDLTRALHVAASVRPLLYLLVVCNVLLRRTLLLVAEYFWHFFVCRIDHFLEWILKPVGAR